jgi:hypothetical protein
MIYLIHSKNFCKCHNVPPPSTTVKEKNNKASFKRKKRSLRVRLGVVMVMTLISATEKAEVEGSWLVQGQPKQN